MFTCTYCGETNNSDVILQCSECRKKYCHECRDNTFVYDRKNCIYCAKERIYVMCDGCDNIFDTVDIRKKCIPCHKNFCIDCINKENHGFYCTYDV